MRKIPDAPTTAVIYTRFSPRRNAKDCESLEKQLDACRNYCTFHHLEVVGCFEDAAMSGKTAINRPGLQEALMAVAKHKSVFVVYSLCRMSRSLRDTITIAEDVRRVGGNLASVTQKIDTTTIYGQAFFQIMAVFAEMTRKQTSETTSAAMLYHQTQGRRMSSKFNLPYGWKLDPDNPARMLPDEYELSVIEEIKKLKKKGLSLRGIGAALDEAGLHPRQSETVFKGRKVLLGRWHHTLINRILIRAEQFVV